MEIEERLAKLEEKSLQVQLQPTEKENLKNNLFEGIFDDVPEDATETNLKVIWKGKEYYLATNRQPVSNNSYGGEVSSTGTAVSLPDGWTCSQVDSGKYNVVHNLGHTNFGVTVSVNASNMGERIVGFVQSKTSTSFNVWFIALSLTNTAFDFTLTTND